MQPPTDRALPPRPPRPRIRPRLALAALAALPAIGCGDRAPATDDSFVLDPARSAELLAWERDRWAELAAPGVQPVLGRAFDVHGPFETHVGAGLEGARALRAEDGAQVELGAAGEARLVFGPDGRVRLPRAWFGDGVALVVAHLEGARGDRVALEWRTSEGAEPERFAVRLALPHDRPVLYFPGHRATGDPWLRGVDGTAEVTLRTLSVARGEPGEVLSSLRQILR